MKKEKINIVWFKRDLRIHDHAAIYNASKEQYPVLPIYIVEPKYWEQPFASRRHWSFIYDCLVELRNSCEKIGQSLCVRVGNVIDVFDELSKDHDIQTIYAHEETGNDWTYKRDISVTKWCNTNNTRFVE